MADGKRPNIKLVCFDLDGTITNFDLYERLLRMGRSRSSLRRKDATSEHIDKAFEGRDHGGIRNRSELLQTIRDIMGKGIRVAIVSHNIYWRQFPDVLRRVGLTDEEIAKIHLSQCEPNDSNWPSKEALIKKAMGVLLWDKGKVALVDDNREIVDFANRAGYNVIQTHFEEGDIRYLNQVREWVGLAPLTPREQPVTAPVPDPVPDVQSSPGRAAATEDRRRTAASDPRDELHL